MDNINKTKKQRVNELRKKYRNRNKSKKYNEEQKYSSEKLPESIPSEIQDKPKPISVPISLPIEINKGKKFIMPETEIIKYIFSNYQKYNYIKKQRENSNEYPVTFDELFLFDINNIPNRLNVNLNIQVQQNTEFSLDKLISYSIYTTSPYWFNEDIKFLLNEYTNQLGKDLRRGDYIINNDNKYSRDLFQSLMISSDSDINIIPKNEINENDLQNYKEIEESDFKIIANYYYNVLNKTAKSNNVTSFNDNINNKICLLSIQNINNFIFTNILGPWISKLISPEQAFIISANVLNSNIIINISQISIEIHMKCGLLFSKDGVLDPEIPFGDLEAKLFFDLLNNSYKFNLLKIIYNLESNSLITTNQPLTNTNNIQQETSKSSIMQNIGTTINSNPKILYGTAAAGISGALIALPFLLGGKSKKIRKINKNIKKRNTKKYLGK